MPRTITIGYKPLTHHKHSVRVTPVDGQHDGLKLPDLYLTHDVLIFVGVKDYRDFTVNVTIEPK